MGLSSNEVRYKLWVLFIFCLNFTTLFVVPGLLIKKIVGSLRNQSQRYIVFFIIYLVYAVFIFYNLMKEKASLEKDGNASFFILHVGGVFSAAVQFNFISKIGVGIISMLSGFSIVYLPFEYFRYYDPLITQINKSKIEEDMASILEEIKNEKTELAQLALEIEKPEVEEKPTGLMSSILGSVFGKKLNRFEKNLEKHKRAVKINQQLLNSLFIDYNEISKEERNFELASKQKVWTLLEKGLAMVLIVYGLYKILTTVIYLMLGRNKPTDPISVSLKVAGR